MCGITGIVNLNGTISNMPLHIRIMTETLRHRGPDGEGYFFLSDTTTISAYGKDTPRGAIDSGMDYSPDIHIENVSNSNLKFALGHRRLSIIDISEAGHQPMCDAEKKIWIVFNGEIYNHIELREELKKNGVLFQTDTDTEVIIQSYLYWGETCVDHFNGMWAFVIYDRRKNILFGSRDRVGVKPFYYFKDSSAFVFASEQKALLKIPYVKSGINSKVASEFLVGDVNYVERGEENMFKNIFELMPAHNFKLNLSSGQFTKWTYYILKTTLETTFFRENKFIQYRDVTEQLLLNAVKMRLRSDVPVGSCLSGGIDSSVIVGIIGKLISDGCPVNLGERLNVFTLSFDDKSVDESNWAKFVVDKTNAEWNLVSPTADDLFKDFQEMNYAQDVPVCSTGTYGQFQLMRRAKEKGIKVVLDGQGGDELFGGYDFHAQSFWRELIRKNKFRSAYYEMSPNGKLFSNGKLLAKDFLKNQAISFLPKTSHAKLLKSYFHHTNFLNEQVVNQFILGESLNQQQDLKKSNSLNGALLRDFVGTRLKMFLKYEDRSSMWHSVEARTPFADDLPLVEYVFSLPSVYKIRHGINKHLLREAARNFIPNEIRERRDKLGFVTPIEEWMKTMKPQCLELLDDSDSEFINVKKIKSDPNKFFEISNHSDAVRVFRIISFAVWKKLFNI